MLLGRCLLEDNYVSIRPPAPKHVPALLCISFWTSSPENIDTEMLGILPWGVCWNQKDGGSLGLRITKRTQKDVSCSGSLEFLNTIFLIQREFFPSPLQMGTEVTSEALVISSPLTMCFLWGLQDHGLERSLLKAMGFYFPHSQLSEEKLKDKSFYRCYNLSC